VQEGCDVDYIHTEIQNFSPEPITLRSTMGLVITFNIPRGCRFTQLLQYLESNKNELGIISITLSAASLEGQFLRCS